MSDNDLLEMFRRREGDVRSPASAPRRLVARTRRREWLFVGIGVVVAFVMVLGSIAGIRQLSSSDGSQPGGVVPATTKTISGITITYPEQWFAEDPVAIGLQPNDVPRTLPTLVLALTRDDPQIQGVLGCPRMASLPGQVLMTVRERPLALSGEASADWPVSLRPVDLSADVVGGCYEGWTFMRATWTAAGRSFEARLSFAPDASDADRGALLDAYSSMTFAPGSVAALETVTLGSGTAFGDVAWSLRATLDENGVSWTLQSENAGFGRGPVDGDPVAPAIEVNGMGADGQFAVMILPSDVRSVVLETGGEVIGDIGLFPLPARWGDARFAVIPLPGSGTGTVRFQDQHGNDLYASQPISWEASGVPSQSPAEGSTGRQLPWQFGTGGPITAYGTFAGINWKVEVLYYLDGVCLTIAGTPEELGVIRLTEPIVRPLDAKGFDALILVLTDLSVERVSVESEGTWDGRWMPASTGAGGEARLWVVEVPGSGTGNLLLNGQVSGQVRWP